MSIENEQPSPAEDALAPIAQAAAETPVVDAPTSAGPQLVDAWFNEFFHNSLASRDAQIFNHCQAAKEELKRRLAAL